MARSVRRPRGRYRRQRCSPRPPCRLGRRRPLSRHRALRAGRPAWVPPPLPQSRSSPGSRRRRPRGEVRVLLIRKGRPRSHHPRLPPGARQLPAIPRWPRPLTPRRQRGVLPPSRTRPPRQKHRPRQPGTAPVPLTPIPSTVTDPRPPPGDHRRPLTRSLGRPIRLRRHLPGLSPPRVTRSRHLLVSSPLGPGPSRRQHGRPLRPTPTNPARLGRVTASLRSKLTKARLPAGVSQGQAITRTGELRRTSCRTRRRPGRPRLERRSSRHGRSPPRAARRPGETRSSRAPVQRGMNRRTSSARPPRGRPRPRLRRLGRQRPRLRRLDLRKRPRWLRHHRGPRPPGRRAWEPAAMVAGIRPPGRQYSRARPVRPTKPRASRCSRKSRLASSRHRRQRHRGGRRKHQVELRPQREIHAPTRPRPRSRRGRRPTPHRPAKRCRTPWS